MKKDVLYAMAAIATLASCQNEQLPPADNADPNAPVEITLGMTNKANVELMSTRGAGAKSTWNGEEVYVYGYDTRDQEGNVLINGVKAKAPTTGLSAITWAASDTHYYYDGSGVYNFYAMYTDDATISSPSLALAEVPATEITDGKKLASEGFSVNVEFDGTQDLMVASTWRKKDMASNPTEAVEQWTNKNDLTDQDSVVVYSAWSARKEVVPELNFKHLLSRLQFNAKGSTLDNLSESPITITKIEFIDAQNEGTLTVVPATKGQQSWVATGKTANLSITPNKQVSKAEPTPEEQNMGEILLMPGASYNVSIYTSQTIKGKEITGTIKVPELKPEKTEFLAGKKYTVNLTVFSAKEIEVKASLEEWKDGDTVPEINTDDKPSMPKEESEEGKA